MKPTDNLINQLTELARTYAFETTDFYSEAVETLETFDQKNRTNLTQILTYADIMDGETAMEYIAKEIKQGINIQTFLNIVADMSKGINYRGFAMFKLDVYGHLTAISTKEILADLLAEIEQARQ